MWTIVRVAISVALGAAALSGVQAIPRSKCRNLARGLARNLPEPEGQSCDRAQAAAQAKAICKTGVCDNRRRAACKALLTQDLVDDIFPTTCCEIEDCECGEPQCAGDCVAKMSCECGPDVCPDQMCPFKDYCECGPGVCPGEECPPPRQFVLGTGLGCVASCSAVGLVCEPDVAIDAPLCERGITSLGIRWIGPFACNDGYSCLTDADASVGWYCNTETRQDCDSVVIDGALPICSCCQTS
eukprot:CAMPEP_0198308786 /NCGR_PEP_ID=MMETSP1450-20131203/1349_1 /TAXON_ID=753684 ORGANISM="Madagascaria erythrocladiodes, Strain CCMP3234" /NCGR_SAMPLE_ID=MMETSP1450 /ASSEMBLY_ACC=CAM_ASM_001115 /LENGTH=241 /DNA_ID=CAMNT_0044011495 /DNA_START=314 /DNA_END=1039 /DNA_ORIENTATION=-